MHSFDLSECNYKYYKSSKNITIKKKNQKSYTT